MSHGFTGSPEPESSGLSGVAAVKYLALVAILLAILAFVVWYLIPVMSP